MVVFMLDTFMTIFILLVILPYLVDNSDLLLNLPLNFILNVCLSVPAIHLLEAIQIDSKHLSYLGNDRVVMVEIVVMEQG
jgi:hypothetical protein